MEQQTATATTDAATEQFLAQRYCAKLKNTEEMIAKYRASFEKDWATAFEWNAADMYANQTVRMLLENLVRMADEHGYLAAFIEMEESLTRFLDQPFNVRESSTNAISNEASSIKYKTYMEFRAWLRQTMREEKTWNKA